MRSPCALLLLCASAVRADAPSATGMKDTIAVMDFNAANASASDASTLSGFIRGAVVRSDKYLVVEKKNMDKILAEQAFQQTGCTSSECAVKLGKILNARKMIVGEYTVLDGIRFLTDSLVDVETGQIERTAKVKDFDLRSADEAADRLVAILTGVALPSDTASGFHAEAPAKPLRPRAVRTRFGVGLGARNYSMRWKSDFSGASIVGSAHTGEYAGATLTRSVRATGPELTAEYWRTFSETGSAGFGASGGVFVPNSPKSLWVYSVKGSPATGSPMTFFNDLGTGSRPGAQAEVDLFWNLKDWLNVLAGANVATYTFYSEWGGYDDGKGTATSVGHFGSGNSPSGTAVLASAVVGAEFFALERFSARVTVSFGPGATVHFAPHQQFGDVGGTADITVQPAPIVEAKLLVNF